MAFPQDIQDIVTELHIGGGWRDITDDVRYSQGISISRGQSPEASSLDPCECEFTIDNRSGNYSPRNPVGAYYGTLGRNTPSRTQIRKVRDQFARVVASGWGNAPTGSTSTTAWSTAGTSAVASGTATHTVSAANSHTITYLAGVSLADAEVMTTWSYATADVAGGTIEPGNLVLRMASTSSYYMARVAVTTTETITVAIHSFADGQLVAPVTMPFSHVAGQQVRVRFAAEGQTLRAKVWLASGLEPYDWTVSVHHEALTAGAVGVRTGVATGNTNTPVTVTYRDFQLLRPRVAVEISEWPARWDTSGKDVRTPIQGAGLLRRLGQGSAPLRSALRRTLPGVTGLVAYWPCEEGRDSTSIATALPDGQLMALSGTPSFGAYSDIKASDPLPTTNSAQWAGWVTPYVDTGKVQYRFLLHVPDTGDTDGSVIANIYTTGTAFLWEVIYLTGGAVKVRAWNTPTSMVLDTGPLGANLDGKDFQVSLELQNTGGNVGWVLGFLEVGQPGGFFWSGTLVGYQLGVAGQCNIDPTRSLTGTAVGHITVQNTITSFFDRVLQLNAYIGETAGVRAQRLCLEEGVPFEYIGTLTTTSKMGPQTSMSLLDLLEECVRAAMATMYEARGHLTLVFRTAASDYNQPATLTLDYSDHQVAELEPTNDDRLIRNDVTAHRTDGSSFQTAQTTGPLAMTDPQRGGVGRYATSVTVNVQSDLQLPDTAGWLLHKGTVDDERYPKITVNLGNSRIVAAGLADAVLDMDAGRRLAIVNTKAGQPPGPISQLVRGYGEQFDQASHVIEFGCEPEAPYQVLAVETVLGRLDSDRTTTGAAMTTTSPSLVLAGERWTTTDVPFDLGVTGEQMTVTAVTNTAPSWVSAGTAAHGDNASVVPGLPAGAVAGDILVIVAGIRNFSATVNTPAGYSSIAGLGNLNIMTKVHSGSEVAPTVSFSGGAAGDSTSAVMFALRNCPSTFFGQANGASVPAVQNIALPTVGGDIANGIAIAVGHKFDDWTGAAPPAGYTEGIDVSTTLGNDQGITVAYMTFTGALVQGADQFTITGGAGASNRAIIMMFGNWQTATVTRSVNGVVKAHNPGEKVSLYRPSYLAA
jgi:hypothetical protein